MCLLFNPHFFVSSTSHLLHTTQKGVMKTADFGTHLAAGRWRSKVLSLSSNCVEV